MGSASGLFRFCFDVNRAGDRVDYRGAGNPNLRRQIAGFPRVDCRNRGHSGSGVDETDVPKGRGVRTGIIVGVKSIDAVMLGRDVDDVVGPLAGNGDV